MQAQANVELDLALLITRGGVARIRDGCGVELHVEHGSVWVTQADSTEDVVLHAGDSFRIARNGVTLVSACGARTLFALVRIERRASAKAPMRSHIAGRFWAWRASPRLESAPRWHL